MREPRLEWVDQVKHVVYQEVERSAEHHYCELFADGALVATIAPEYGRLLTPPRKARWFGHPNLPGISWISAQFGSEFRGSLSRQGLYKKEMQAEIERLVTFWFAAQEGPERPA